MIYIQIYIYENCEKYRGDFYRKWKCNLETFTIILSRFAIHQYRRNNGMVKATVNNVIHPFNHI